MITAASYIHAQLPHTLQAQESATAYAPANIALSKYWGKRDKALNLPDNSSVSLSLGQLGTHTRIEFSQTGSDALYLNHEAVAPESQFSQQLWQFVGYFRRQQALPLCINTYNSIPTAAGLASSASGYAALTLALNRFFQLNLSEAQLSAIARLGSGSACRSLWHGFVHWQKGVAADGSDSIAHVLENHWETLCIALVDIDFSEKAISSRNGMLHTKQTSPLYPAWPMQAEKDCQTLIEAIKAKDFEQLGTTAEANALLMHATMLAARPALRYLQAQSLVALDKIAQLRADGVGAYATIDAGPNLKILYLAQDKASISQAFPNAIHIAPFAPDAVTTQAIQY